MIGKTSMRPMIREKKKIDLFVIGSKNNDYHMSMRVSSY